MIITTQILKEISIAAKTSEFAVQKLDNAKKSFNKIKDKAAFIEKKPNTTK